MNVASAPFAPGSVSFRSYPHDELDAEEKIAELCAQGALVAAHGFDGVTTTTMSFSNGYEMTMVDATYAAPSDTCICQVGGAGPSNQDHAVITFHEGLLRFIRGELPRPLGCPNLDWPGGFRHPHWH